jgi:hypothetical protein
MKKKFLLPIIILAILLIVGGVYLVLSKVPTKEVKKSPDKKKNVEQVNTKTYDNSYIELYGHYVELILTDDKNKDFRGIFINLKDYNAPCLLLKKDIVTKKNKIYSLELLTIKNDKVEAIKSSMNYKPIVLYEKATKEKKLYFKSIPNDVVKNINYIDPLIPVTMDNPYSGFVVEVDKDTSKKEFASKYKEKAIDLEYTINKKSIIGDLNRMYKNIKNIEEFTFK